MSDLEASCIPILKPMIQDNPRSLDALEQKSIALWAVKTTMVADSINKRTREYFYFQNEREMLRVSSKIALQTGVWIGRYAENALHFDGGDLSLKIPERTIGGNKIPSSFDHATLNTIIMDHLVIQVLAVRATVTNITERRIFSTILGRWGENLISIWPAKPRIQWPPQLSFINTADSIGMLVRRWNVRAGI
jgi:hypothetical protein